MLHADRNPRVSHHRVEDRLPSLLAEARVQLRGGVCEEPAPALWRRQLAVARDEVLVLAQRLVLLDGRLPQQREELLATYAPFDVVPDLGQQVNLNVTHAQRIVRGDKLPEAVVEQLGVRGPRSRECLEGRPIGLLLLPVEVL